MRTPLKAFYLGSSHSSSLALHGKVRSTSFPGASSSPVSLASQTAPGMVGFLACLGTPVPCEPSAAAHPCRTTAPPTIYWSREPLLGVNSRDSLIDHHPHSVTPPVTFDIQLLTWASRTLSARTLQAEAKMEVSPQPCCPACILCRQRSVSTRANHSL